MTRRCRRGNIAASEKTQSRFRTSASAPGASRSPLYPAPTTLIIVRRRNARATRIVNSKCYRRNYGVGIDSNCRVLASRGGATDIVGARGLVGCGGGREQIGAGGSPHG